LIDSENDLKLNQTFHQLLIHFPNILLDTSKWLHS